MLAIVALDHGLFRDAGLTVELRTYPSGKRALIEGLTAHQVDVAMASDVPTALLGFDDSNFRILASTCQADNVNRIVARRSSGIENAADLRGKRIATQRASAVHYFQDAFLAEHGIGPNQYHAEFLSAEALVPALKGRRIDAFSMREPYVSAARKALGGDIEIFAAGGLYPQVDLLVADKDWLAHDPRPASRLIRAMLAAERIYREDPEKAYAVTALRLGVSVQEVAATLDGLPKISLDQTLLPRLESIGQWATDTGLVARETPDYLPLVDAGPLGENAPDRVTLIR
jgi:ABC-type nitrate/sulfonate/bicarbonate transport system substrate-binding protein